MSSSALQQSRTTSGWIISPLWDCVFFLVTPLAGLAVAISLDVVVFDTAALIIVTGVIATGHHLPGFLRTYGDPELLTRYRGRLLVAPVLLAAACVGFRVTGVTGLDAILLIWGTWHVLMQNYGIMRIYGARKGEVSRLTSWLDWALMLTWITAVYLSSPAWSYGLHENLYRSGMPVLPLGVTQSVPTFAWCLAGATSLVYVWHLNRESKRGRRTSPLKLLLLITTLLFYSLGFQLTSNILVITIVVELVHDLQYYALAWVFQRRLVEKRPEASLFMRVLFRPGLVVLVVYCGLSFAYGAALTEEVAEQLNAAPGVITVISGLLAAATIFHFYTDGFIWKVRQPRTREYLGIEGKARKANVSQPAEPATLRRSLIHLGLFAAIVAVLTGAHLTAAPPSLELYESLARQYPNLGAAHHTLGYALHQAGHTREAIREYQRAVELGVDNPGALVNRFANALEAERLYPQAVVLLRESLEDDPFRSKEERRYVVRPLLRILATCPDERLRDADEVERLIESHRPEDPIQLADYLEIAAVARDNAGQRLKAVALYRRALAILSESDPETRTPQVQEQLRRIQAALAVDKSG